MYGKFFASTFTGSMCGAGPAVFAVWGYVIANTVDSQVELNPKFLASVIGAPEAAIAQAIKELCEPDPLSRNPTNEGRRLEREGQFQYRVTSHAIYRALNSTDQLREYNRQKQREFRQKKRDKQDRQTQKSLTVKESNPIQRQDTEAYTETKANTEDRGYLDQQAEREEFGKASLSPAAQSKTTKNGKDNTTPITTNGDPFLDRTITTRAGAFIERYRTTLYPTHRHGAKYNSREHRDYDAAVRLCETWDDARLDKLAICFLTTDHKFAEEGSRTIPQFRALASWLDGELSKWEAGRKES